MTRRNLVPEQRVDKNGHVITRWMKPFFRKSSPAVAIPAPEPTREPLDNSQEHRRMLIAAIERKANGVNGVPTGNLIGLQKSSPMDLYLLVELLRMDEEVAVAAIINTSGSSSVRDAVNVAAVYDPSLMPEISSSDQKVVMINRALDVAYSKVLGGGFLQSEDRKYYYYDQSKRAALKMFVKLKISADINGTTLDDELADHILDPNWEHAKEAAEYLELTPSLTKAQLDHLLAGGNPTLSSGAL